MNNRFDELTKSMAQSVTRRAALKKFGISVAVRAILAVLFVLVMPARATIVLVGGQNYDIELLTTSLSASSSTLKLQPWWNDQARATLFAQALGNELGTPNQVYSTLYGPFFAYSDAPSLGNGYAAAYQSTPPGHNILSFDRTGTFEFATATPVPEPSTCIAAALLLLPLGFSSVRLITQRRCIRTLTNTQNESDHNYAE